MLVEMESWHAGDLTETGYFLVETKKSSTELDEYADSPLG